MMVKYQNGTATACDFPVEIETQYGTRTAYVDVKWNVYEGLDSLSIERFFTDYSASGQHEAGLLAWIGREHIIEQVKEEPDLLTK